MLVVLTVVDGGAVVVVVEAGVDDDGDDDDVEVPVLVVDGPDVVVDAVVVEVSSVPAQEAKPAAMTTTIDAITDRGCTIRTVPTSRALVPGAEVTGALDGFDPPLDVTLESA